ncbi:Colicin V secretion protein CvaA [Delftia sp. K82]|uniref:HlyD family secretion protein n=1 Tax=Delftia sp. K82 TaxID=1472718 RepID=UPI000B48DFF9|nr:HlyD family efflux transporter periplasmic adaptor subunit [Delftia sp. K82]OWG13820.1 Colicin V secretion protein CvaA [Delftia sp. K82]
MTLFRKESLDSKRFKLDGHVLMIRPFSFAVLTTFSITTFLSIAIILLFSTYSRHSTVKGQLLPATGQIRVFSQQPGVVIAKYAKEGQYVEKGDILYKISSERFGEDAVAVFSQITRSLEQRRESLIDEHTKFLQLHLAERQTLNRKIASLRVELSVLAEQVKSQRNLLALADNAIQRYQGLLDKGYISKDQFQQRQAEQLGQIQVLQRLRREQTSLEQQAVERTNELAGLDSRQKNQLAQINRQLSMLTQELTESEARRAFVITAPEAGTATAVFAEVGHSIDARLLLMLIVPTDSYLVAELYAPSKAIGFIKLGDPVNIRYQAYPYQKFGIHRGRLASISRTSLSPFDFSSTVNLLPGSGEVAEPLYRLRVELDSQAVTAYGKAQELQSGMLLEADILQESRRLYEWILEPIYSISGKFPK